MTAVGDFARMHGFRVVSEAPGLTTLSIPATEIVRATCRLRKALENDGVFLYEAKHPFTLPCAWVEYDGATLCARIQLLLTDAQLTGR